MKEVYDLQRKSRKLEREVRKLEREVRKLERITTLKQALDWIKNSNSKIGKEAWELLLQMRRAGYSPTDPRLITALMEEYRVSIERFRKG